MQPKTEVQKRVVKLKDRLPDLTKNQLIWGQNLFDRWKYEWKHDYTCMECGYKFPKSKRTTCPKCKSKLQLYKGRSRKDNDYWYMSVFTTIKEFQVLRYFRINKYMKVGIPADYHYKEVYQHWISNTGKHVLLSKTIRPFSSWSFDPWCHNVDLEVRLVSSEKHLIKDIPMYPYRKILSEIYRNGFVDEYYKFHPAQLFTMLLGSTIAETFIKAGNINMLQVFSKNQKEFTKYWHCYKICMKHGYNIKDWSTWLDHMKLLKYFKYDTHNPKYICSSTFIEDHNKLLRKKRIIDERIAKEKRLRDKAKFEADEKERIRREQIILEKKKKYFDLVFTDGKIKIIVLSKIKDFKQEGKVLQHCVYQNKYYNKPFSLILSARRRNTRLETIELDLHDMKILQCHGYEHTQSKYHNEILELMNNSINKIKEVA